MVMGFLEHFEFCHRVEPDWLGEIQSNQVLSDDEYYLFLALLTSENVPQVWEGSCESSYCFITKLASRMYPFIDFKYSIQTQLFSMRSVKIKYEGWPIACTHSMTLLGEL